MFDGVGRPLPGQVLDTFENPWAGDRDFHAELVGLHSTDAPFISSGGNLLVAPIDVCPWTRRRPVPQNLMTSAPYFMFSSDL